MSRCVVAAERPAARSPDRPPPTDRWAGAGLRVEQEGPLATVTLDRPEQRNAQTPSTWRALAEIGERLLADGTRVVVLRAEGPSFSAGLDRAMFRRAGPDGEPACWSWPRCRQAELDRGHRRFQEAFTWWRRGPHRLGRGRAGHAVGAGFQLALACDLRVLADDAQLRMRETSLGLVPDLAGTKPLVDLVGYPRALEICATGRWVDAAEAVRLGLAELVVPRADLDATVDDLAAALLARAAGCRAGDQGAAACAPPAVRHDEQRAAERAAQGRRLRELAQMTRSG